MAGCPVDADHARDHNAGRCTGCGCSACLSRNTAEAVQNHFRTAGVEFLKGLRLLLDTSIQELEPKPKTGSKITVE